MKMGSKDLTDGVFAWPEGLHHYIENHNVWLPSEFIDYINDNLIVDPLKINLKILGFRDDIWWKLIKRIC